MIITFNINTIDVNSSNPERITKSAHFIFEAGFFILRRLKLVWKIQENRKGRIYYAITIFYKKIYN